MTSPVSTAVKFMHADMVSAPALAGIAGALITVLDAFLVNGFAVKAVDSGTISNGVCRLNFSGVSAADLNAVLQVAGVVPAGLNGEQKVTNFSSSWLEFKTDLPDGAVTGAGTFKMAALGWEKVFSKTNVAVYRPVDPAGSRPFVRIDDTNALAARVTMYEGMTDVDTGFNPSPPVSAVAGGFYWWKRTAAGATGSQFALVGDSRGFYFAAMPAQSVGTMGAQGFTVCYAGDLNSYRSGDAYGAMLTGGNSTAISAGASSAYGNVFAPDPVTTRSIMRRASGLGAAQTCDRTAYGAFLSGSAGPLGQAPTPANNGLYLTPIIVSDGGTLASNGPRGEFPGALSSPQTGVPGLLGSGLGQIKGSGPFAGKALLRLQTGTRIDGGAETLGTGFVDITGPWRV